MSAICRRCILICVVNSLLFPLPSPSPLLLLMLLFLFS